MASRCSITTEIFRSDAPCAIARTLTAAFDSALNTFAAAPGVPAMPSPTTARMLQSVATATSWIWPCLSSDSKAWRTIRSVTAASGRGTAKQIECSELACEMRITEI